MARDRMRHNAYHKEYELKRYHKRRLAAIEQLGGKCVKCGSVQDLQLDHVDPKKKTFTLSQYWGASEKKFQAELSKCQVLCEGCHLKKTVVENSTVKGKHGTYWNYKKYGCRCTKCHIAFTEKCRIYKAKYFAKLMGR